MTTDWIKKNNQFDQHQSVFECLHKIYDKIKTNPDDWGIKIKKPKKKKQSPTPQPKLTREERYALKHGQVHPKKDFISSRKRKHHSLSGSLQPLEPPIAPQPPSKKLKISLNEEEDDDDDDDADMKDKSNDKEEADDDDNANKQISIETVEQHITKLKEIKIHTDYAKFCQNSRFLIIEKTFTLSPGSDIIKRIEQLV